MNQIPVNITPFDNERIDNRPKIVNGWYVITGVLLALTIGSLILVYELAIDRTSTELIYDNRNLHKQIDRLKSELDADRIALLNAELRASESLSQIAEKTPRIDQHALDAIFAQVNGLGVQKLPVDAAVSCD